MTIQACFVNTDQYPIKTEHVCYYTSGDSEEISLFEIVKEYHPHPDAPEEAIVDVMCTRHVVTYKRIQARAANAILLEAAQKACVRI
jgi:hypothetical protein